MVHFGTGARYCHGPREGKKSHITHGLEWLSVLWVRLGIM